jgi:hypothetical protein
VNEATKADESKRDTGMKDICICIYRAGQMDSGVQSIEFDKIEKKQDASV